VHVQGAGSAAAACALSICGMCMRVCDMRIDAYMRAHDTCDVRREEDGRCEIAREVICDLLGLGLGLGDGM
jgi:hypothetical protein